MHLFLLTRIVCYNKKNKLKRLYEKMSSFTIKKKLGIIERNSLEKFYNIVRENYFNGQKNILSNKIISFLEKNKKAWCDSLNKVEPEDFANGQNGLLLNFEPDEIEVLLNKGKITDEYLGFLFFSDINTGAYHKQFNYLKSRGLYENATSNPDSSVMKYAIDKMKLKFVLLSSMDEDLKEIVIDEMEDRIKSSVDIMNYLYDYFRYNELLKIENHENIDKVIKSLVQKDKMKYFNISAIIDITQEDFDIFKEDGVFENIKDKKLQEEIKESFKDKFALYERRNINKELTSYENKLIIKKRL